LSIQIKAGRERFVRKFIEEDKTSETFYIIAVEGSKKISDGRKEVVERFVLKGVRFLSWDEKRYETKYNADKDLGLRGWRYAGGFLGRMGMDSEKRNTLTIVRGLPRDRLDPSWSIELEELERITERHGVRGAITLDVLPRKQEG